MSNGEKSYRFEEDAQVRALAAFTRDQASDARWFYPSLGHRDALGRLQLLTTPGALVVITGESGAGKSLLVEVAKSSLPLQVVPVLAGTPDETNTDVRLLRSLIAGAGFAPQGRTGLELTTELFDWTAGLGREGRIAAFIIDDAHLRPSSQLEIVRSLLSSASGRTPLSAVLLGEPDLLDKLQRKRNLAGRISLHYSLNPLTDIDGAALIEHRLATAGCDPELVFTAAQRIELARRSSGNPGELVRLARMSLDHTFEASGRPRDARPDDVAGMSRGIPISEPEGSQTQ